MRLRALWLASHLEVLQMQSINHAATRSVKELLWVCSRNQSHKHFRKSAEIPALPCLRTGSWMSFLHFLVMHESSNGGSFGSFRNCKQKLQLEAGTPLRREADKECCTSCHHYHHHHHHHHHHIHDREDDDDVSDDDSWKDNGDDCGDDYHDDDDDGDREMMIILLTMIIILMLTITNIHTKT